MKVVKTIFIVIAIALKILELFALHFTHAELSNLFLVLTTYIMIILLKVLSCKEKTWCRKATSGCPMLRKQKLQTVFKHEVQNRGAMDIEDLVQLGNKIGTCSYYGARNMVLSSDIVVLPYQSLLLRPARESLGLNLKNNIIIIDEAHNLADSLTSMYNAKITQTQVNILNMCDHLWI